MYQNLNFILLYLTLNFCADFNLVNERSVVHMTYNSIDWKQLMLLKIAIRVLIYSELQTFRKTPTSSKPNGYQQ